MGIPLSDSSSAASNTISLKELVRIAKEYGKELKAAEKAEKSRLAKEKAEKLIRQTLSQRLQSTEISRRILGERYTIPVENWKIKESKYGHDISYTAYVELGPRLRLVYVSKSQKLVFHIKSTGYYNSWDYPQEKPCNNWEDFCKGVASYAGKIEEA